MMHDNVINVDVQMVSYIVIYLSIGIFSKLFYWVIVSSCLLCVLFSLCINDT